MAQAVGGSAGSSGSGERRAPAAGPGTAAPAGVRRSPPRPDAHSRHRAKPEPPRRRWQRPPLRTARGQPRTPTILGEFLGARGIGQRGILAGGECLQDADRLGWWGRARPAVAPAVDRQPVGGRRGRAPAWPSHELTFPNEAAPSVRGCRRHAGRRREPRARACAGPDDRLQRGSGPDRERSGRGRDLDSPCRVGRRGDRSGQRDVVSGRPAPAVLVVRPRRPFEPGVRLERDRRRRPQPEQPRPAGAAQHHRGPDLGSGSGRAGRHPAGYVAA